LPAEKFAALWEHVRAEHYADPFASGRWLKAWSLTDGYPLGGPEYSFLRRPWGNALDALGGACVRAARDHESLVGGWADLVLRCCLYPRGVRIGWHADSADRTGSLTYYAHPAWSGAWG